SEQVALRLVVTRVKNAHWGLCQPETALAINSEGRAVVTSRPLVEELDADEASVLMFSGHPQEALAVLERINGTDRRTRTVRAIRGSAILATAGRTAEAGEGRVSGLSVPLSGRSRPENAHRDPTHRHEQ